MKRSLLTAIVFSVIMALTLPLSAYVYDYTFTQTTGTYTEITGGTLLGTETNDDQRFVDPAVPAGGFTNTGPGFPIGFSFPFNDNPFDVVGICANGWMSFGQSSLGTVAVDLNTTSSYTPLSTTTVISPAQLTNRIAGFARDIQAQAGASLRMETIGSAPNRICVIQWKNYKRYGTTGTGDVINFQIQLHETTNKVVIAYGACTHGATASTSYPQVGMRGPETTDFANRSTVDNWSATTAGTTNAATCAFTATCVPLSGLMFEYTPPPTVANDLQAMSLTGPTGPSQGTPADYIVTVRNRGSAAQSNYTVQLMSGTTVLASVAGPAINPEQVLQVTLTHTFMATGPVTVFGRIVFAADQNMANNDTNNLDVVVQASGTLLVEIGTGISTQRQPFGIYYSYERDASLYTAAEIGAFGAVTALKWYCDATTADVVPYKIYLKTITESTIPALNWATMTADATQMLDTTVTFGTPGWVMFNFATPFVYTGGNLLVLVETNITDWVSPYPTFRYTSAATGTHQYWAQDNTPPTGNGTANTSRPNIGIFLVTSGMGHLTGTVTSGTTPLEDAMVSINTTTYTATTSATGTYNIQYIPQGPYTVTCSKVGYVTQTQNVTIAENQTSTLNFNMVASPTVSVTGTVVGSDAPTVGLADAAVELEGILEYSATTNAQGQFTIPNVLGSETYAYTITKAGYQQAAGSINVGATAYNMGTVILNEMAYPPSQVQAVEAAPNVNLTWTAPDPNAVNITESFEGDAFPPAEWSQVVTNTGPANTLGVYPTWCRVGEYTPSGSTPVTPQEGSWQVSMWWDYAHQDEWLITPQFVCPAGASLTFNAYIFLGSTHDDHYYVKASDDNGATWDILWDACAQTGNDYSNYTVPMSVPLSAYAGQQIKLAWHADDPPSADGMWNIAAFDNVVIGSPTRTITFDINDMEFRTAGATRIHTTPVIGNGSIKHSKAEDMGLETPKAKAPVITPARDERALLGYKVWRLLEGQEANEAAWTVLTPNTISATAYTDAGWASVPDGMYKWAVKAVYTGNVLSTPALSNAIQKLTQIGTVAGIVRQSNNSPIAGATISVVGQSVTATSNTTGAYSLQLPAGTYTMNCAAAGFAPATQTGVVVVTDQTTTVNFVLAPSGNVLEESFEGATFPPAGWTQIITETGPANTYGVTPTWCRVGAYTPSGGDPVTPPDGTWQASMWWSYNHQDEWLISPQFTCPNAAELSFHGYIFLGSTHDDHYYVKASDDGGTTWDILWDSCAQTGNDYSNYAVPFEISLAAYAGQNIKLAWHADDPPSADGMWNIAAIDNIIVSGQVSNDETVAPVTVTALKGNFPNPFHPETTISYSVKASTPVVVEIYNVKGQKVKTLVNENKAAGNHEVTWNGKDESGRTVTSGVYFYKMNAGSYSATRKMIMLP